MVILYNRYIAPKNYKKNKHRKTKISKKANTQRITSENKIFLKSLGLKVLV